MKKSVMTCSIAPCQATRHGTQLTGVERADEDVCHDVLHSSLPSNKTWHTTDRSGES